MVLIMEIILSLNISTTIIKRQKRWDYTKDHWTPTQKQFDEYT